MKICSKNITFLVYTSNLIIYILLKFFCYSYKIITIFISFSYTHMNFITINFFTT